MRSKALALSVRNQEEEIKNITFNINVQKSFLPLGLAGVVGVTVTAYSKRKKSDTPPSF